MAGSRPTNDDIVERGQALYERDVRARVEPQHNGQFLAIDIETGAYAIGPTAIEAIRDIKRQRPNAMLYILRVGHPAAYRLGGKSLVNHR